MKIAGLFTAALFSLVTVLPALAAPALAAPACKCRFKGGYVNEGSTICMKTPRGATLAKCVKVLNNTSWEISKTPCPVAFKSPTKNIDQNFTPFPTLPIIAFSDKIRS